MPTRRSIALVLAPAAIVGLIAAACSSSPKATAEYTKGATVFFTPDGGKAPVLPASFVSCTYGKVTGSDHTEVSKLTSSASANSLPDATGVRLTRAANDCDASLTNQLIETSVFEGAPATISAEQKTCATSKIISAIAALDDTKLKGTNSSEVSNVAENAAKACGISTSG